MPDKPPVEDDTFDPEEHIKRLVKDFEKRLRQQMPQGAETLEEIEKKAQKIGREIQEKVQEEFLGALGSGYQGKQTSCRCGRMARFVACSPRQVLTLAGVGHLRRAYYHCRACKQGFCPLDALLGLGEGQCSTGVRALLCRFASYLPFGKAAKEMEIACGITLSKSTLHRQAQAVGKALEQVWAHKEEQLWHERAPVPRHRPSALHLSMDGVLIFVGGEWKEVKCGVAYESGKDEAGRAQGVERANYYATLAPSSGFGRRMRTLAHQSGTASCRKVAMVADGAEWIWQETGKHFPQSVQILDYYHACEHLWQVAHSRFGAGSAAEEWMGVQQERLLSEQVHSEQVHQVIAAIESWEAGSEAQRELRRKVRAYLSGHAHRMDYARLRKVGWHIGSGVMESACKGVVQERMKGRGMRWSSSGAEAMLHLRSDWCSSDHVDFTAAARRAAVPS